MLYKPKFHFISPIFKLNLKCSEKVSQLTLLGLVFDGFTLCYAADHVLNSIVLS